MTVPYSGEKIARVNNIEICYDTFGEGTNPSVLFIMGLAGQMVAWEDDFCKEIKGLVSEVQVTIDGDKKTHNKLRSNSYKESIKGIKKLKHQ